MTSPETVTIPLPAPRIAELRESTGEYGEQQDYVSPAEFCGRPDDFDPEWDDDGDLRPLGCGKAIDPGAEVRKVGRMWLHSACAVGVLRKSSPDGAWLLLAEHLARRPRDFKTSETRAIVAAVVRIASRGGA